MTEYTDAERDTLRTGAFGAMMLVSQADPGFFATFKESMAGSKALASSSPELRDLLKSGGIPKVPKDSPDAMEAGVLSALTQSTQILQAKAPEELDAYRGAIVTACEAVAGASDGVKPVETEAIGKVKTALGVA
jgi:hypothetical protein